MIVRGWSDLITDSRYGLRMLLRSPGFTLVAVVSLALGIGANTAIFSIVNAILLRPLPVKDPGSLVTLYTSDHSGPAYGASSYPDFLEIEKASTGLVSGLATYGDFAVSLRANAETERGWAEFVSANFFSTLGIDAIRGRIFLPADQPESVAVISHRLWQTRYGSDSQIAGKNITVNAQDYTIVGVAPASFNGPQRYVGVDVWLPVGQQSSDLRNNRGSRSMMIVARLKPGVTPQQLQTLCTLTAAQLFKAYPDSWEDVQHKGRRITVLTESASRVPPGFRTNVVAFMVMLLAVVGLVLLVACANIANLLLARANGRRREIAVRIALGAGKFRLVRQLLTESMWLSFAGGAVGLLLAVWLTNLISIFQPPLPFRLVLDLGIDTYVLLFTMAVSMLTGLLFGLLPALQSTTTDVTPALKEAINAIAFRNHHFNLRNILAVAQTAGSLVLLVGAGLFLQSLRNAHAIDVGFEARDQVLLSVDLRPNGYPESRARQLYARLLERAQSIPGVKAAAWAYSLPLDLMAGRRSFQVEGYQARPGEDRELNFNVVGPEYFAIMGIPLQQGRAIDAEDREGGPGAVVVNQRFVQRYWPGQNPIGKRVIARSPAGGQSFQVVGVVRTGKYRSLGEDPLPYIYLPAAQYYMRQMTLHVRAAESLLPVLKSELQSIDKNMPIFNVKTMDEHLSFTLFPARIAASLLGSFGLLALALAAIGIYGVMAYSVAQRTKEIGIRMALGATRSDVLRDVVGSGFMLSGTGVAIGLVAAFALARLLTGFLYRISPADPIVFTSVSLLLITVATIASWLPALRAVRVDPMTALRYE